MIKNKIRIPAMLVHNVNGTQYKLNGTLIAINESNDTCTMQFRNRTTSGIPMDKVYINEGFIDTLKSISSKVKNWISKKVKGFYIAVTEKGEYIQNSIFNIANIAISFAKGLTPDAVHFYPSDSLAEQLGLPKVDDDEILAESIHRDAVYATNILQQLHDRIGTHDESLKESVTYIYNKFHKRRYDSINEAGAHTWSLGQHSKDTDVDDGKPVNSRELKQIIKNYIRASLQFDRYENGMETRVYTLKNRPQINTPFIWGAPGIGKTTIIKQVIKDLRHDPITPLSLNFQDITLSGKTIESFDIPVPIELPGYPGMGKRAMNTPVKWIPVIPAVSDPDELEKYDDYFNGSYFLTGSSGKDEEGNQYQGGVVFFDEFTRVGQSNVYDILMNLIMDKKYGDSFIVASGWCFIVAANRATDDGADLDDERYRFAGAKNSRFAHYLFVPEIDEWLEWAKSIDPITHESNVPRMLTDFLETCGEGVYYECILGTDKEGNPLPRGEGAWDFLMKEKGAERPGLKYSDNHEDDDMTTINAKRMTYNFRTWGSFITTHVKQMLYMLFADKDDKQNRSKSLKDTLSVPQRYKDLVDESQEKVYNDKIGKEVTRYYGGISPDILGRELANMSNKDWDTFLKEYDALFVNDKEKVDLNAARTNRDAVKKYRLRVINDIIGNIIKTDTNDSSEGNGTSLTGISDKSGLPTKSWYNYQLYAKQFTPECYRHIWETGKVLKYFQDDDDKTYTTLNDYNKNTLYSRWKQNAVIAKFVVLQLFNPTGNDSFRINKYYPNQALNKDIEEDIITFNGVFGQKIAPNIRDEFYDKWKRTNGGMSKDELLKLFNSYKYSQTYVNSSNVNQLRVSDEEITDFYNAIKGTSVTSDAFKNAVKHYLGLFNLILTDTELNKIKNEYMNKYVFRNNNFINRLLSEKYYKQVHPMVWQTQLKMLKYSKVLQNIFNALYYVGKVSDQVSSNNSAQELLTFLNNSSNNNTDAKGWFQESLEKNTYKHAYESPNGIRNAILVQDVTLIQSSQAKAYKSELEARDWMVPIKEFLIGIVGRTDKIEV